MQPTQTSRCKSYVPQSNTNSHRRHGDQNKPPDHVNHVYYPMNTYAVPSIPHHYNPFSPLQHIALPTQMNTSYPQHNSCGYVGQNQTYHPGFTISGLAHFAQPPRQY